MEIILASQSPRRREILNMAGLNFKVMASEADEDLDESIPPWAYVKTLALKKAEWVFKNHPNDCVIGLDTVVYIDGAIIGKPKDERDAYNILQTLSGRAHRVYTGVALLTREKKLVKHEVTKVTFNDISHEEINWYIKTKEPMDKAGAYGVQGPGGIFVKKVHGNYFNVVGLPLPLLYNMLKEADMQVFAYE